MPSQSEVAYQPNSKLMSLPLDLIVAIFNILEPHDSVALSITCQGLHQHLFADARTRFKNASRKEQYMVQTMLEKGLSHDESYCPFCKKFHTLDQLYRDKYCCESEVYSFATYLPNVKASTLKYLDARAIMNAINFKRSSVGEALQPLHRKLKTGKAEGRWRHIWEPRVIDEQLFLKVTSSHTHGAALISSNEDEFVYNVCPHVHVNARFPIMQIDASQVSRLVYTGVRCCSSTCLTCRADWTVNVEWTTAKEWTLCTAEEGWAVEFNSWHRLGSLRSPYDAAWGRSAGEERSQKPVWQRSSRHIIFVNETQMLWYPAPPPASRVGTSQKIWMEEEKRDAS